MDAAEETIVAIATAHGRSAVGIVRLSGPLSRPIAESVTHKTISPRQVQLSNFFAKNETRIDQGLVLYFPAPASYSGEDVVEFQTHGSMQVLYKLQQTCVEHGARLARPGEFTERAFLNGKIDLAQAEAVADIIDAQTEQGLVSANQSLQGDFSLRIQQLQQQITEARVLAEGLLDFPEEDTGQEQSIMGARLDSITHETKALLHSANKQALYRHGVSVAILGQPNVGKSSLLNRLAGKDLAIVTDIPGTTRDRLEQTLAIEGVVIRFIDTAGIHETIDVVEQAGIERSFAAAEEANIILWVSDISAPSVSEQGAIPLTAVAAEPKCWIHVQNKIDQIGAQPDNISKGDQIIVSVSAKTGAGIDLLQQALYQLITEMELAEDVQQLRSRHIDVVRRVITHTDNAKKMAKQSSSALELVADELRLAQQALSEITGEYLPDDLLGEIFSRFCIGK